MQNLSDRHGAGRSETLISLLRARAAEKPTAVAFRFKSRGLWHAVTWRALEERVAALAIGFRDSGIASGRCVAVVGDASPSWLCSILALHGLGAWPLSLYQGLGPEEIGHVFGTASIAAIVVDGIDWLGVLEKQGVRAPERVLLSSDGLAPLEWDGRPVVTLGSIEKAGRDRLRAAPKEWDELTRSRGADDPAALVSTAGTSEMPRIVVHSSASLIAGGRAVLAGLDPSRPIGPNDAAVLELPTGHIGALLVAIVLPLLTGMVAHLPEPELAVEATNEVCPTISIALGRVWELQAARVQIAARLAKGLRGRVFRAAEESRRTATRAARAGTRRSPLNAIGSSVSFALVFVPLLRKFGLERMRHALVVGAISPRVAERWHAWGVELRPAYGTAETGLLVARQVGPALVPAAGVELQTDPAGNLLIRTGALFRGMLEDSSIRPASDRGGWFRSGDLAAAGERGPILVGRASDHTPGSGAARFSLAEVQAALRSSPYIRTAAVIRQAGGDVHAVIDLNLDSVVRWGSSVSLSYSTPASLRESPDVLALIAAEVSAVNEVLVARQLPAVTAIAISREPFAVGRELSPTYDVRARRIQIPDGLTRVGALS